MHDNTAVGGRESDDTAGQWLEADMQSDSGSEWEVARNSKKKENPCCGKTSAQILRLRDSLVTVLILLQEPPELQI